MTAGNRETGWGQGTSGTGAGRCLSIRRRTPWRWSECIRPPQRLYAEPRRQPTRESIDDAESVAFQGSTWSSRDSGVLISVPDRQGVKGFDAVHGPQPAEVVDLDAETPCAGVANFGGQCVSIRDQAVCPGDNARFANQGFDSAGHVRDSSVLDDPAD